MGIWTDLEEKQKADEVLQRRTRIYNDIAYILWYQVAYDDILKHKKEQMEVQQEPFRIYDFGERAMRFGPISALTGAEDTDKFEKRARALLKDRGFGVFKVKAYPDAIIVSRV